MANVDVVIVAMTAKCLKCELCGPRICTKTLLDKENDALSEIAALFKTAVHFEDKHIVIRGGEPDYQTMLK